MDYSTAAVAIESNRTRYAELGLIESESVTLMVAAAELSALATPTAPALGDVMTWGGSTFTVRDVAPFNPDGSTDASGFATPIYYTVIGSL